MKHNFLWLLLASVVLVSCAKLGIGNSKPSKSRAPSPYGASGIPPALRAKGTENGTPATPGGNALPNQANLTPEDEIIFTDPDNPEANIPELTALLENAPKTRSPWEQSEEVAKQRAAREGKPLLIWFTDSKNSPMCKALSQELFSTPEFEKWAAEKLIRLRVDANVTASDPNLSLGEREDRLVEVRKFTLGLKKQYKILGQPSLILLNPSGEVIGRYRGYKRGQAAFQWGLLKQGEAASSSAYQKWRSDLEKKGYREWSDRKDRKVLAKLLQYTDGTLILIEPDGTRCRTHENKLSNQDREWIDQQKKLRNLQ